MKNDREYFLPMTIQMPIEIARKYSEKWLEAVSNIKHDDDHVAIEKLREIEQEMRNYGKDD